MSEDTLRRTCAARRSSSRTFAHVKAALGTASFMHIISGVWCSQLEVVILDGWPQQMEYHIIICTLPGSNHRALQIENFFSFLLAHRGQSFDSA